MTLQKKTTLLNSTTKVRMEKHTFILWQLLYQYKKLRNNASICFYVKMIDKRFMSCVHVSVNDLNINLLSKCHSAFERKSNCLCSSYV